MGKQNVTIQLIAYRAFWGTKAYIIGTIIVAIALGVSILVMGIKVTTAFNREDRAPPGNIKCYYNSDTGDGLRFRLVVSNQKATGVPPKNISEVGQTVAWTDTGFVTNGQPMEVYVNGSWYPWGQRLNAKSIGTTYITTSDGSTEGGTMQAVQQITTEAECKFSTDIEYVTSDEKEKQFNALMRYNNNSTGIASLENQNENIMDVHCLDNKCQNKRPPGDHYFSSCALTKGHGIYMKIGDAAHAYHLANHIIYVKEKVIDPSTQQYINRVITDEAGIPLRYIIPFTLPTKIYQQNSDPNDVHSITYNNPAFINADATNTPNIALAQDINKDDINEIEAPEENQPIYVATNDIYYNDNDGEVEIFFKSGAKKYNPSDTNNMGIFSKIAMLALECLYGKQGAQQEGSMVDISDRENGIVVSFRNSLLQNYSFQIIKTLLLILSVTMYGYRIITADATIKASDLIQKIILIGIIVWGTQPDNYAFADRIVMPFFFKLFSSIANIMIKAATTVAGISVDARNPFLAFDVILSSLYSEVIGYKIVALFTSTATGFIALIPIFITMIILSIAMLKAFSIVVIAVIILGLGNVCFPLILIGCVFKQTRTWLENWIGVMIRETFGICFFLMGITLFFAFAVKYFLRLFYFDICWNKVLTLGIPSILSFDIFTWKIQGSYGDLQLLTNLALFAITCYIAMRAPDEIQQFITRILPDGNDVGLSVGKSFSNFITNIVPQRILGGNQNYGLLSPLTSFSSKYSSIRNTIHGTIRATGIGDLATALLPSRIPKKVNKGNTKTPNASATRPSTAPIGTAPNTGNIPNSTSLSGGVSSPNTATQNLSRATNIDLTQPGQVAGNLASNKTTTLDRSSDLYNLIGQLKAGPGGKKPVFLPNDSDLKQLGIDLSKVSQHQVQTLRDKFAEITNDLSDTLNQRDNYLKQSLNKASGGGTENIYGAREQTQARAVPTDGPPSKPIARSGTEAANIRSATLDSQTQARAVPTDGPPSKPIARSGTEAANIRSATLDSQTQARAVPTDGPPSKPIARSGTEAANIRSATLDSQTQARAVPTDGPPSKPIARSGTEAADIRSATLDSQTQARAVPTDGPPSKPIARSGTEAADIRSVADDRNVTKIAIPQLSSQALNEVQAQGIGQVKASGVTDVIPQPQDTNKDGENTRTAAEKRAREIAHQEEQMKISRAKRDIREIKGNIEQDLDSLLNEEKDAKAKEEIMKGLIAQAAEMSKVAAEAKGRHAARTDGGLEIKDDSSTEAWAGEYEEQVKILDLLTKQQLQT